MAKIVILGAGVMGSAMARWFLWAYAAIGTLTFAFQLWVRLPVCADACGPSVVKAVIWAVIWPASWIVYLVGFA